MLVSLHHITHYRYDRSIALGPQVIRLRPAPHCRTPIRSYSLRITPQEHFLNWQQDPQGNYMARLVFPEKTREFRVEVDIVAELIAINPFDFFLEDSASQYPVKYTEVQKKELEPFLEKMTPGPLLKELIDKFKDHKGETNDFLVMVNRAIQQRVNYLIRLEPGIQAPEETLEKGCGSCRDSAWLLVNLMRHLGIAARFVSGYLIQLQSDPDETLDGPDGPENDFTDLHAWTEVYLPGAGWVGLDATSGLMAAEGHIPLACNSDPPNAAAISGAIEPCESTMHFEMHVKRLKEPPRTTKPYTDEQWHAIHELGQKVDAQLQADDVRLRMGGEPTFISADNRDADEWNTGAVGQEKQTKGAKLLERLRQRYGANGLVHFGQGKWYPGEPLPRWVYNLYWRTDGEPLWSDPSLFAMEAKDYGQTIEQAREWLEVLTEKLNVDSRYIRDAYENPLEYIDEERKVPVNVKPGDVKLDDPQERARIAKLFDTQLSKPTGFVLPLDRRRFSPARWVTGPWMTRSERLLLLAGDSPVGLRLPVASLPYLPENEFPWLYPQDPTERRSPLSSQRRRVAVGASSTPRQMIRPQLPDDEFVMPEEMDPLKEEELTEEDREKWEAKKKNIVFDLYTALCVEIRDGCLRVFLPPTRSLEDFVDLINAIEAASAECEMPLVIEGYGPPPDSRIQKLSLAPDPGVLEINVHPLDTWEELVELNEGLYRDAQRAGLTADKHMLDGRYAGSGGGAHVTLGGPTPLDSPFLRRPDLLKSMLAYWVNHPSLSYTFSSLFIGPTSQAPRIDEARHESVYELEIAFQQINDDLPCPPWLVDRVFRNLLTDLTGNTHRSEFCIDKLYSPDSSSGRLGILELRAFEMQPHPHANLVQQLLVRAIVARCWREKYRAPLKHWGQELHDRFMLPYYLMKDLRWVVNDLNDHGFPFRLEWFQPHLGFRFPVFGSIEFKGIELEIQAALEPWNVLGEEPGGGGTTRFVDSSVERVQVRVRGFDPDRYIVSCNNRRVPLHKADAIDDYVGGVRFRAWQPPNCLHPTIPVQAPLVFDIIDTWHCKAVAGCTYHVSHPGGRSHEDQPINARAAETRRRARFFPHGHTPGAVQIPSNEFNQFMPHTLDMRF
ncbi:IMP dehydrogenase [Planctomycetales bacterium 10988]|nr:IMP dehydrogenase [Planctomycetales bacterium 10988]